MFPMATLTADALAAALHRHRWSEIGALPGRTNHLRAGILVPLLLDPTPTAILTERPATMRDHPGEISFPGGKHEPTDASWEATALREAHEELGIEAARVLGRLSSFPLYTSDFRLEPFVAALPHDRFEPDAHEVVRVVRIELDPLLRRTHLDGIEFREPGHEHVSPIFQAGDRFVFGGTAAVLHELLHVLAPLMGVPVPPLRAGRYGWSDVVPVG